MTVVVWITTVDGRNPAAPGMYKIWKFTISTGAGFLPSTARPGRQLQKKNNLLAPRLTKTLLFAGQFQKGSFFWVKKNKAIPNKGVDYGLVYSLVQLTKFLRGVFLLMMKDCLGKCLRILPKAPPRPKCATSGRCPKSMWCFVGHGLKEFFQKVFSRMLFQHDVQLYIIKLH